MNKKLIWRLILVGVIVLATCIRLYDLAGNPPGLNQDEVVNGYDAYCLSTNLRDHHGASLPVMFESFGDWVSPVLTYITVPFVKALGSSNFSVRLPVALLGIFSILLCYQLVKEIFNKELLALLSAFLLTISPWHIINSRWAIPPSIIPFFLTFSLLFFVKAYKQFTKKNYKKYLIFMFISALGFGITTHTYPTMKMFVPIFFGILCLICYMRSIKMFKSNFKLLIGPLLLFAIIVLPIFILTFRNPAKYQFRFSQVSIFGSGQNPVLLFITNFLAYFSPDFLFRRGDFDTMHSIANLGVMHGFEGVFFYLGIVLLILLLLNKKIFEFKGLHTKIFAAMLLAWLFLFPLTGSITVNSRHTLRAIQALPVIEIASAFGIFSFFKSLSSFLSDKKISIALILAFLLISLESLGFYLLTYFTDYKDSVRTSFQYGVKEAMMYVKDHEEAYDKIVIDRSITCTYIYVLFYLKKDPESLNYEDFASETGVGWINVKNFDKYFFEELDEKDFDDTQELEKISTKGKDYYKIYSRNETLFVNRVDNEN